MFLFVALFLTFKKSMMKPFLWLEFYLKKLFISWESLNNIFVIFLKTCFCLFDVFSVPNLDLVHVEWKVPLLQFFFFHYWWIIKNFTKMQLIWSHFLLWNIIIMLHIISKVLYSIYIFIYLFKIIHLLCHFYILVYITHKQ